VNPRQKKTAAGGDRQRNRPPKRASNLEVLTLISVVGFFMAPQYRTTAQGC
jgi:hypothetical protein